jgi:DNA-binding NarL/FixJ family response regulator
LIYRVLVVDDYEPWRRQIKSALQASPRWRVVGEAADGLDAVQKAHALRPDLILLDVGLPVLNGIDAARRILALDPDRRILFLSENQSWDVVEAALGAGGFGYVLKSDAGRDLLSAMAAVVEGQRFISRSLTGHGFDKTEPERVAREASHVAAFYSHDAALVDDYARFAEAALKAGKGLIVVSLDSRRRGLEQGLQARGIDVDHATGDGRYRWTDVADALSNVIVDDWPDEARFRNVMPAFIMEAAAASIGERPRVAAWGECAPTLWRDGKAEAAIRLEHLWDELARAYDLDIFCAYSRKDLPHDEDGHVFQEICAAHSVVHSR